MKNQVSISILAIVVAVIIGIAGCKKDSPAANLAYVGNFAGAISNSSGPLGLDTLKITAGSSANLITVFDVTDSIYFAGTVSGNSITALSGTSVNNGTCSNEPFTGTGSLNSNTITYTLRGNYTCNGTAYRDTLTYSGIKY